jgi:hypothetical protein
MKKVAADELLRLLEGDSELLHILSEVGIIDENASGFAPEEVEVILISRTLVRELEINGPGVDVILRLRKQLLLTRKRLAEIARRSS